MSETAQPVAQPATDTPIDAVRGFAEQLMKTVEVARALVDSNREVDLTGLERDIGLLCAKSLDLPPDEGRQIRPRLIALSGSVEALSRALRAHAPQAD